MRTFSAEADKNLNDWTGIPPREGAIQSLPLLNLNSSRQQILDYFNNSWTLTEVLFSGLANQDAFYRRPYHQLRHPLVFYYVHPAVLYVNKLRVAGLIKDPVNAAFEHLFEVGVDEMRWDDLREGQKNIWPPLVEATAYRKKVYQLIHDLIQSHPDLDSKKLPIRQESPLWALVMGFEHERIHFETSSVLIRELPIECVRKPAQWPLSLLSKSKSEVIKNTMIAVPQIQIELGKPHDWPSFGWDNEYGHEIRICDSFFASQFLISNGEYKEFVQAGGYSEEKFWSHEGWAWRKFRNIKSPPFWVSEGPAGLHAYKLRTIFEIIEMPWDWPVCVNFYEAKAYCQWRTQHEESSTPYRLLTEVEHKAIRESSINDVSLGVQRDSVMSGSWQKKGYNLNLSTGSESPVQANPPNDKGFHDTFGNVWKWCEDPFQPLPDSKPHPYYEDFSVPCYDGQHQMLFGGSFASTGDEASIWSRFHFRPHFVQHSGFRIARSDQNLGSALYESQEMINKYMLMHWGTDQDILGAVPAGPRPEVVHLPKKCAELVLKHSTNFERALDLGCAVGRSTFELAKNFKQVLGIDYSSEFIECAQQLKKDKQMTYWRKDSGTKGAHITCQIDSNIDVSRLNFEKGDACALPLGLKNFDAVLLANVLCRLPDPVKCLERMQGENGLVKPGGILVMTTPLSWLEDYTPKSRWLNGLEDIKKVLSDFELIDQEELPFMIREHHRKFEYIITQASVWRRK